ncbi:MAG: ATP-dependent 6-phosphofructokinase [Acidobacteria bacterium]|nr:ATP-dependent 6-phosphofructokinase [Acidobacteriota bacterium]
MRAKNRKTIAVSTGGGDCPGLNAVIRAVVRTAISKYDYEVVGIEEGFNSLIEAEPPRKLTLSDVRGILRRGGTILGTTSRGDPFHYPEMRRGTLRMVDRSAHVLRRIEELNLQGLIVIGGDGTLSIANELHQKGAPVVGIPKSIDNDLSATEVTFGFDSATVTATDAIDKLHTTAESHHRVMVIELMGRNAGWIALVSGIAGGADVILIPEIPFDLQKVCAKIMQRSRSHRHAFSIVVVAEGAYAVGGSAVYLPQQGDGGALRLGGIGQQVGDLIAARTNQEVRVTVLGHIQRGGSPTPFDRLLATRFGAAAVDLVACRQFGRMVSLSCNQITAVALKDAIKKPKQVDPDGEIVRTAKAVGIVFGDQ